MHARRRKIKAERKTAQIHNHTQSSRATKSHFELRLAELLLLPVQASSVASSNPTHPRSRIRVCNDLAPIVLSRQTTTAEQSKWEELARSMMDMSLKRSRQVRTTGRAEDDTREQMNIPRLQILIDGRSLKEHKHALLVADIGHEPSKARASHVVPDLQPVSHRSLATSPVLQRPGFDQHALLVSRTQHQRPIPRRLPLTKENSPHGVAEEPLTLSRDGVRCPLFTTQALSQKIAIGPGRARGTRWRCI